MATNPACASASLVRRNERGLGAVGRWALASCRCFRAAEKLRLITCSWWSTRRYLNMEPLKEAQIAKRIWSKCVVAGQQFLDPTRHTKLRVDG
jgi:hypothetical protein